VVVIDNVFNQENYPDMIGRILSEPPAYACVQIVEEFDDIDREFYMDGVGD
jgi:hypothetical protein